MRAYGLLLGCIGLLGCGGGSSDRPAAYGMCSVGPVTAEARASKAQTSQDPLGPRPEIAAPAPFTPPAPTVYRRANGLTVWLLERPALPIVSIQLVVPAGSSEDPSGQGGLAWATASMLDEGAGKRSALQIASDVDALGATLHTGAFADYAFVDLTVLKKNLEPALSIFGDVVVRPTFSATEWNRVHTLWENDLKARQSEPNAVARVVSAKKFFPSGHPYAHPTTGTLGTVGKVTLPSVKAFYEKTWKPAQATLVVAGDVTRPEIDALLDRTFASWKGGERIGGETRPSVRSAPSTPNDAKMRVFVVDRADAPQSVVSVVRGGVAANDPDAAGLVRVDGALGGSFTSRLNQDLREEHGWSYGAHSRVAFSRRPGTISADAAVHTEHTGEALQAMLTDITTFAKEGMTPEEVGKTKLLARGALVEAYEGVGASTARLARLAGTGLESDFDAKNSARIDAATKAEIDALAARFLDLSSAVVVIVGPKAAIEPQLRKIGITNIETSGPEGE